MRDAINRLRLVSDAQVEFEPRRLPSRAAIDAARMAQVLDNLLGNAVKYSPPTETISVDVQDGGDQLILSVRDRGNGIPASDLDRVFARFYRSPRGRDATPGEGLGLAICNEIVTCHGGRIWATSPGPGMGSTFWVALPKAKVADPVPQLDSTP